MIEFTLLVLVVVVMILGGLFLLPESLLAGLSPHNYPETPGGGGVDDPANLVEIAKAYEASEKYHEALQLWTRYLDETNDTNGFFRRALVLQRLERHDRAIDDFLTVANRDESLPDHYFLYRARSWRELDEAEKALSDYRRYFEADTGNFESWLDAARYAAREGRDDLAESWFNQIAEQADIPQREEAKLELAEFCVDRDDVERARGIMDSLEDSTLTEHQQLAYMFVKARIHEERGKSEQAHELFRTLYDRDTGFRNVEQKVKEHSATIDDENLLHEYRMLDRDEYAECCRNVVRLMGFEPMETHYLNEEEVDVSARNKTSQLLKMDRYLFSFKQWDGYVGVLALKEFELSLLEGRYDRGFFVAPRGFKPSAMDYAEDSPKMELVGPDQLVEQLREIL